MAGTGATWKDSGASKGTPLYGFGFYFAERITKAGWGFGPRLQAHVGLQTVDVDNVEIEILAVRAKLFLIFLAAAQSRFLGWAYVLLL